MRYKGIIFDFNGVLLWDGLLQEKAWKINSKKLRGFELNDEEIKYKVHGIKNKSILEYLLNKELGKDEVYKMTIEKEDLYRSLCLELGDNFRLSPGAINLFEYLLEQRIPFTIATASEQTNVDFFIKHLELNKWFDKSRIVFDDGKLNGKPHPDIYEIAASKIGVNPSECIVVEDAVAGIESAQRAGIGYIVAMGGKEKHSELSVIQGVDLVITNFNELPRKKLFSR